MFIHSISSHYLCLFDTHIIMPYSLPMGIWDYPEFTGNGVIIPGKAIFVVENDLFQIISVLSLEWDPYRCILRGTLDISKFPWIYRKWRHNSRKSNFCDGKQLISNTFSIISRMRPISMHFTWYFRHFEISLDLQEMTSQFQEIWIFLLGLRLKLFILVQGTSVPKMTLLAQFARLFYHTPTLFVFLLD